MITLSLQNLKKPRWKFLGNNSFEFDETFFCVECVEFLSWRSSREKEEKRERGRNFFFQSIKKKRKKGL